MVLLGDFHATRILLLSELGRDGQSELLSQTNDLHADVVVAGLPEKGEPLCNDLIAAIQPHVIVIADSDYPVARRASRALHERMDRTNIPVIYTRAAGAVKIVMDKTGWKLQTMDGQNFSPAFLSAQLKRNEFQE
jgi:beta-lactamase superfamily II metal-dependent hydrolase